MAADLEILYEDNHLIAVNKLKGLLTQPSGTQEDSLEAQVKALIKIRDQKPGNVFLEAVHRLDRPVSGIVLFAKTSKAISRLNALQRDRKFGKIYQARVSGAMSSESGELEHYLSHGDHRADVVQEGHPNGKLARLEYHVLEQDSATSLVEVRLHTGRYHQIRAQLAAVGCPILGDTRYGSTVPQEAGIALHHRELILSHPVRDEQLTITCPV